MRLTERELQVLGGIAAGMTNLAIAGRLGVSHSTVAFHVGNLLRKAGVNNRTQLALLASELRSLPGQVVGGAGNPSGSEDAHTERARS